LPFLPACSKVFERLRGTIPRETFRTAEATWCRLRNVVRSGIIMNKQVEYLQRLFYDIWNDFGSVYLIVKHSDRTIIGKRGFTDEEKKQGLILVFNNQTNNSLTWDAEGNVTCILAFGTRKEDIFIHHDDLLGVFSPEAKVQFVRSDAGEEPPAAPDIDIGKGESRQVVSMSDFKKGRSKIN
jgi:hypothetical protein